MYKSDNEFDDDDERIKYVCMKNLHSYYKIINDITKKMIKLF